MGRKRLPPQFREELTRLYVDERLSMGRVATMLDVDPDTVKRHLKLLRIPLRSGGPKALQSEEFDAEIKQLYAEQWTLEMIADRFWTTKATIARHLRRLGVSIRPAHRAPKLPPPEI